MKIVEQSVEILPVGGILDGVSVIEHLERIGRTCYKSADKITEGSAEKFVRGIIKSGHESVIEHVSTSAKFITSRDVTHQIVRHRLAAQSQESQRYCNYSLEKFGEEVVFVKPVYLNAGTHPYYIWVRSCDQAQSAYFDLIQSGCSAEEARAVLPNCCKTELVMTADLREWRHFFKVRCDKHAQQPIRELALVLLDKMNTAIPVVFEDLYEKHQKNIIPLVKQGA